MPSNKVRTRFAPSPTGYMPVSYTHLVVEFLANHPQVEKVNHPSLPDHPDHALYEKYFPNGGASIFTFNIKGGREEAFKFIDNLKIFSLLANVADVKSLVIHPASTTHSQLNDEELAEQQIYQNTIRLSIGTEHIDDIIADLEAGFAADVYKRQAPMWRSAKRTPPTAATAHRRETPSRATSC